MPLTVTLKSVLKLGFALAIFVVAPVLIILAERAAFRLWVTEIFGFENSNREFFYFALVTFSLMLYLMLIVVAVRTWEEILREGLNARLRRMFRCWRKSSGNRWSANQRIESDSCCFNGCCVDIRWSGCKCGCFRN